MEVKAKNFRLNLFNIYKMFDGKKYQLTSVVPKNMEYDIKRIYQKHGLILKIEKDELDKIKIWSRRR